MNIAIYDRDTENRRPWNDFIGSEHQIVDLQQLALLQGQADLLFAHGSYLDQEGVNAFRASSPTVPLVVISGGHPQTWWKDDAQSYWRKAVVGKPGRDFSIWCQRFLNRLSGDRVLEFGLLEPSCEAELAFRLLCEAKQFCGESPFSRVNDIIIHAPSKLEHWLAPFDKNPEDDKAVDQAAGLIGSGDVKASAEAVLKTVNSNGETLTRAIEAFLNPQPEPPAQP